MRNLRSAFIAVFLAAAQPALAHEVIQGVDGFYGGVLHPLLAPIHLLAVVGLGLFVGQPPGGQRSGLELIFAIALAGGLAAVGFGMGETPAPLILLTTALISSIFVVIARPAPKIVGWLLAVATGASIGLDSPPDVVSIRMAWIMLIGTELGAVLVLTIVTACAARFLRPWQKIALRVLGSWTAACAILVLATRLVR
jgi:urease accessory protein